MAKRTYALAIALALVVSPVEAMTVKHDNGGVVLEYAKRTHRLIKSGEKVKIDGKCASACTLYLAVPKKNICITPRAVLMFHHPFDKNTKKLAKGTAEFMMYNYPKWVQNYINKKGGLSRKWITISYSYAKKYMRTC
jgi:hypothetical protein